MEAGHNARNRHQQQDRRHHVRQQRQLAQGSQQPERKPGHRVGRQRSEQQREGRCRRRQERAVLQVTRKVGDAKQVLVVAEGDRAGPERRRVRGILAIRLDR